jgi:hypothetical protein
MVNQWARDRDYPDREIRIRGLKSGTYTYICRLLFDIT